MRNSIRLGRSQHPPVLSGPLAAPPPAKRQEHWNPSGRENARLPPFRAPNRDSSHNGQRHPRKKRGAQEHKIRKADRKQNKRAPKQSPKCLHHRGSGFHVCGFNASSLPEIPPEATPFSDYLEPLPPLTLCQSRSNPRSAFRISTFPKQAAFLLFP